MKKSILLASLVAAAALAACGQKQDATPVAPPAPEASAPASAPAMDASAPAADASAPAAAASDAASK